MPEPDPRRVRLLELRCQLEALAQEVLATSAGSLDRAALDEQFRKQLEEVLDLRAELEGWPSG